MGIRSRSPRLALMLPSGPIHHPISETARPEEAISLMQADELDRLVVGDRVDWIITEIVCPTVHPDDPPRRESGASKHRLPELRALVNQSARSRSRTIRFR